LCLILTVKNIYENKPYGTSFENLQEWLNALWYSKIMKIIKKQGDAVLQMINLTIPDETVNLNKNSNQPYLI